MFKKAILAFKFTHFCLLCQQNWHLFFFKGLQHQFSTLTLLMHHCRDYKTFYVSHSYLYILAIYSYISTAVCVLWMWNSGGLHSSQDIDLTASSCERKRKREAVLTCSVSTLAVCVCVCKCMKLVAVCLCVRCADVPLWWIYYPAITR